MIAGCSSSTGGGDSTEAISTAVAMDKATWMVLDLQDGSREGYREKPDLSELAGARILFRRIEPGGIQLGSDTSELGHQDDENPRSAPQLPYFISVTECSQAQWRLLAGRDSEPWQQVPDSLRATGDAIPAHGLSRDLVEASLQAWNARHQGVTLHLPTDAQWEAACRYQATHRTYHFADHQQVDGTQAPPKAATLDRYARVFETLAGDSGPGAVATRSPSAAGLYDLHGNLWELTIDPQGTTRLRGGSWRDIAMQARSANRNHIDRAVAHPLVGCRLVLSR